MRRALSKAIACVLAVSLAVPPVPLAWAEEEVAPSEDQTVVAAVEPTLDDAGEEVLATEEPPAASEDLAEDAAATADEVAAAEDELAPADDATTAEDAEPVSEDDALAAESESDEDVLFAQRLEDHSSFKGLEGDSYRFQNGQPVAREIDPDALQALAYSGTWEKDSNGNYRSYDGSVIVGAKSRGVDVSEWQDQPDWARVKADDISFAILRCGGTYTVSKGIYDDSEFERNATECERLGIPYGVYFFSAAETVSKAREEAEYTIKMIGKHKPTLPVYYDLEVEEIADKLSTKQWASIAKEFCGTIAKAGYTPGVYANVTWWENYLTDPVFETWTKWVAQYYKECEYEGTYRLWQADFEADIDGFYGGVDLNFDFEEDYAHERTSDVMERLWGQDAFGTMADIVQKGWSKSQDVVIATSGGYWDALAASSLAGKLGCPVLLTNTDSLNTTTKSEIKRLGATQAYVVGGTLAVKDSVVAELKAAGCTVTRVAGADAPATACSIAAKLGSDHASTCFVATSRTYQDALSASPIAYAKKMPIFLCNATTQKLDADTLSAIKKGGYSKVVLVGGTMAVPDSVKSQLKSAGITNVERVYGQSAYETSTAIATYGLGLGLSANNLGIATGTGYWDALTGAALCGKNGAVLVLVSDANRSAVDDFMGAQSAAIDSAYVFGGRMAVSNLTWNTMVGVLG